MVIERKDGPCLLITSAFGFSRSFDQRSRKANAYISPDFDIHLSIRSEEKRVANPIKALRRKAGKTRAGFWTLFALAILIL